MTLNYEDPVVGSPVALRSLTDPGSGEHVPVRAAHGENAPYLTAQSGFGSFSGAWVETLNFPFLSFTIAWSAVALTAGTLTLQGTDDPAKATASLETIADFTTTVDANAGRASWRIKNPPAFLRVVYTRTAGGSAFQFNAWCTRRSA